MGTVRNLLKIVDYKMKQYWHWLLVPDQWDQQVNVIIVMTRSNI